MEYKIQMGIGAIEKPIHSPIWNYFAGVVSEAGQEKYLVSLDSIIAQEPNNIIAKAQDEIDNTDSKISLLNRNGASYFDEIEPLLNINKVRKQDLEQKFDNDQIRKVQTLRNYIDDLKSKNTLTFNAMQSANLLAVMRRTFSSKAVANLFLNSVSLAKLPTKGPTILLQFSDLEQNIQIPINTIVSADNLHNWYGRQDSNFKDGRLSKDVVQEYSQLESDTAPALQSISGYLFKNGQILFSSPNAHRTAAAIHRGDEFIEVCGPISLQLVDLDEPPMPDYFTQSRDSK